MALQGWAFPRAPGFSPHCGPATSSGVQAPANCGSSGAVRGVDEGAENEALTGVASVGPSARSTATSFASGVLGGVAGTVGAASVAVVAARALCSQRRQRRRQQLRRDAAGLRCNSRWPLPPLQAQGRVIKPPLPPWYNGMGGPGSRPNVIDVTPDRADDEDDEDDSGIFVHPVVAELEAALEGDSLRTICRVLSKASGTIAPAIDNPDRTKKPIMDSTLTIRSLLRFVELRHSTNDDLTPQDLKAKSGAGIRVLLRKCRDYQNEVLLALSTRVDDVITMIRAFYDLPSLISKFLPLFRFIFERATPSMLARQTEPLPRLVNFLEPYGEVQLSLLYEAAESGVLQTRANEFEPAQLLEVVGEWSRRARAGRLAIVVVNKIKFVVRTVALLDLDLPIAQRSEWLAAAVWASATEATPDAERLEHRARDGLLDRSDPGEVLQLAVALCNLSISAEELFKLLSKYLSQAFATAESARIFEVLSHAGPPAFLEYPPSVAKALGDACSAFAKATPVVELEELLALWTQRKFNLLSAADAVTESFVGRIGVEEMPYGSAARCGTHLIELGIKEQQLWSLPQWLLSCPADDPASSSMAASTQPSADGSLSDYNVHERLQVLSNLWPLEGAAALRLTDAEAALVLVGPAVSPLRAADVAAASLTKKLASQLAEVEAELASAITEWVSGEARSDDSEPSKLASVVAPWLLRAARDRSASVAASSSEIAGDLYRSAEQLADAFRGQSLGLQSASWALEPFLGANEVERTEAIGAVAGGCAVGGAPKQVIERASQSWIDRGCPVAGLAYEVVHAAVSTWADAGIVSEAGVEELRAARDWLSVEIGLDDDAAKVEAKTNILLQGALNGVEALTTLIDVIGGKPASFNALKRAKRYVLGQLSRAGQAKLIDSVAFAWAAGVPGVTVAAAAAHFELWWTRQEDDREVAAQLAAGAIEELRHKTQLRADATWGGNLPLGGQTPAWRVEGRRRVPWFLPKSIVSEALGDLEVSPIRGTKWFDNPTKGTLAQDSIIEKAKEKTGGRCIYCGSNNRLRAVLVWPEELGGPMLESNIATACPCCLEFMEQLGAKRWSEALAAKPEDAYHAWWLSQKEANMRSIDFLKN